MDKVAILFITYRRWETALSVFESIKKYRPKKLYFSSNAPNGEGIEEKNKVEKVRGLQKLIDWDCEVKVLNQARHLRVKESITSAIDWFFENEQEGIILEDDCCPSEDFYTFAEVLLDKYRDDSSVYVVTGTNYQEGIKIGDGSYYFSKFNHVWGWATWKRAWKKNDTALKFWPKWRKTQRWKNLWPNFLDRIYWEHIFHKMYFNEINTWDYSWTASIWYNGGMTAVPNANLVKNIGFGVEATNTTDAASNLARLEYGAIEPIVHPTKMEVNQIADEHVQKNNFTPNQSLINLFIKYLIVLNCRVRLYIRNKNEFSQKN